LTKFSHVGIDDTKLSFTADVEERSCCLVLISTLGQIFADFVNTINEKKEDENGRTVDKEYSELKRRL